MVEEPAAGVRNLGPSRQMAIKTKEDGHKKEEGGKNLSKIL